MTPVHTEAALRREINALIEKYGVTQRYLAEVLVVSESWLSRWRHAKKAKPISVNEMDRFRSYIRDFLIRLQEMNTSLDHAKEPLISEAHAPLTADRFRPTGTAGPHRPRKPPSAAKRR